MTASAVGLMSAPLRNAPLRNEARTAARPDVRRVLGLSVPVSVVIAQRPMSIQSILETTVGTIIEFNVSSDADLTLSVGNQPIGRGQAVKIGEHFGLRISQIGSVEERIRAMGNKRG